ncbi:MAG TPA: hypothetical protein VMZ53_03930 [Kofleriaceae bacterium]|nr:hypothetical protein [Kofleriaceae bacterium]
MMSHGDDDDGGDDAQLRSLRAVWLAMPDEDPPERGLDALMAAAHTKAKQMADASSEMPAQAAAEPAIMTSWWERFVALFRRPPMLALATVIVLVAGAVVINNRGMNATAPSTNSAPSPEDVPTERRERESLKDNAPPAMPEASGGAQEQDVRGPRRGTNEGIVKEQATADKGEASNGRAGDSWVGVPLEEKTAEQASKDRLLDDAKTAAARGDCTSARNVARQLEKQDLGYYRSRVAPDPSIADCLQTRATGGTATDPATTTPSD